MIKECVICGTPFECLGTKLTCSDRCSKERRREKGREYYHNHQVECDERNRRWKEANKERYKKYSHEYEVKRWANRKNVKVVQEKPKDSWITKYEKSDRLTKLSMMQLALTEHNIRSMNYGYLSFIYGTDEYKRLEEKVYKAKEAL